MELRKLLPNSWIKSIAFVFLIAVVVILIIVSTASAFPVVYIAQGDPAVIQMDHPEGACWYFPDKELKNHNPMYDVPSVGDGNETYYCNLKPSDTANMPEGRYTMVYTYPAEIVARDNTDLKYLKDISWNGKGIKSLLNGKYKDEFGAQVQTVLTDLRVMVNDSKTDNLQEYSIFVQPPSLTITRHEQTGWDEITASGTSNLIDGTKVTLYVDEFDHATLGDKKKFTFEGVVYRPYTGTSGNWSIKMKMPLQEMSPGWHTSTVYANGMQTSVRWPIYQAWDASPTPTQYINYFGNGSVKPDVVTKTIIMTTVVYQDRWHTATATPDITDALGAKVDYPYKAGEVLSWYVIAAVSIIAILIVLFRDRKV
jgi:hypothetical protein